MAAAVLRILDMTRPDSPWNAVKEKAIHIRLFSGQEIKPDADFEARFAKKAKRSAAARHDVPSRDSITRSLQPLLVSSLASLISAMQRAGITLFRIGSKLSSIAVLGLLTKPYEAVVRHSTPTVPVPSCRPFEPCIRRDANFRTIPSKVRPYYYTIELGKCTLTFERTDGKSCEINAEIQWIILFGRGCHRIRRRVPYTKALWAPLVPRAIPWFEFFLVFQSSTPDSEELRHNYHQGRFTKQTERLRLRFTWSTRSRQPSSRRAMDFGVDGHRFIP
jgi:hypothetical protein